MNNLDLVRICPHCKRLMPNHETTCSRCGGKSVQEEQQG